VNLKGSKDYVVTHAVVGDVPSGCVGNGNASAGFKYNELVTRMMGTTLSICAIDWGTPMEQLANDSFASPLHYLSKQPVESTITVLVDGVSNSDWIYKESLNAVLFNVAPTEGAMKRKTMKIKKSELLALIKEEIMSEMYDDPRMDDAYPEVGEAQKIVDMIMDMSGGDKAAAMEMLKNAMGMLQGEMDVAAEPMMESPELASINRDNVELVGQVIAQMAPLIGTMSLPILIGMIYEKLKEMGAK
jgi:hypothetical protein